MTDENASSASLRTVFPLQLPGPAARVLHIYNQLRSFERLPPPRQDMMLSAQFDHLLNHAQRFAPFWKQRLARRTTPQPSMASRLTEIPLLTRSEVQSEFGRLSAKFPGREKLEISEASTSGSTGTPVKVERANALYLPLYQAMALITAAWHGIESSKPLGVVMRKVKDVDRAPLGTPFRWLGPVAVGFSRSTKDREPPELFEYCAGKNPTYLQCGPTLATSFARYAQENARSDLKPTAILTTGSVITDDIREIVRDALGAKIVDRYSCEETGYIALQCPKHDHLHVMCPVTYVEIIDEYGAPCPVGVPGRVLLTSMQSYAMPLIRYEIGDMGEWGPPCDCGITLPVIKKLWGRTRHLLTTPDGRKTYARIYARDFQDIAGLLAYRFVLHRNETVVAQLRVLEPSPELAAAVIDRVQKALDYPYPVQIRYVDQIDWGNSWKQDYFGVSDAPP